MTSSAQIATVLDVLRGERDAPQYHDCYRALFEMPAADFALVVEAVARSGPGPLAELLDVDFGSWPGLRPRTAVLLSMLSHGRWVERASAQVAANGPDVADALSDRALLVQRARQLQAATPLEPVYTDACYSYALPTTDQAAVLDALRLTGGVPLALIEGLELYDASVDYLRHREAVLVTPALDGWILALRSTYFDRDLEELSARFSTAQYFMHHFQSGCGDISEWMVAEHGKDVLYCCYEMQTGEVEMRPADREEMFAQIHSRSRPGAPPLIRAEDPAFDGPYEWDFEAEAVAHRLSVSVHHLGPHTRVEGTALLTAPLD
jgi:hypothetical protein